MNQSEETTLHQRILRDIEKNILSGTWQPGHRIPFELELARQYACSRMTVNKVLTQLARAGLIERRRKSGSFVMRPQVQSAVLEIHDIQTEVESLGLVHSYDLVSLERRRATAGDRARLDVAPMSDLLSATCVHYANRRPFCLEERVINLETVPEAADETFEIVAPGAWLLRHAPWNAAQHKIFAIAADAGTAGFLDLDRHAACLVVERQTWSDAGPVTQVRLTYPAERHALVARFKPAAP